jgi:hypothetical protein
MIDKETRFFCKKSKENLRFYMCLARVEYKSPGCSEKCEQYIDMGKNKVVMPRSTR